MAPPFAREDPSGLGGPLLRQCAINNSAATLRYAQAVHQRSLPVNRGDPFSVLSGLWKFNNVSQTDAALRMELVDVEHRFSQAIRQGDPEVDLRRCNTEAVASLNPHVMAIVFQRAVQGGVNIDRVLLPNNYVGPKWWPASVRPVYDGYL